MKIEKSKKKNASTNRKKGEKEESKGKEKEEEIDTLKGQMMERTKSGVVVDSCNPTTRRLGIGSGSLTDQYLRKRISDLVT